MGSEPATQLATWDSGLATTRILPAVLLLLFAAQCLWFVGTQSFTVDEPFNLAVGIRHWRGLRNQGNDNPPLLRMLCALPLLGSPAEAVAASEFESDRAVDPVAVAWRTRPVNVLLGVLLGIALWRAARRRFSAGAANFALALFAFSPPLIAHFSIVGTDGIAALMIFVTALQVSAFRHNPNWRQALLTGIVLGLLLLAKLYTLPVYALALLLVALPSPTRLWFWRRTREGACTTQFGKALAMAGVSVVVLWACYWFRGAEVVIGGHRLWLPAGDFAQSILFQLQHGREGHPAYLLGRVSEHGWRYYYPVAIALKWPTVVLVLGMVTAVVLVVGRLRSDPHSVPPTTGETGVGQLQDFGVIFLFPASFFALAIFSTVNIGERYVLAVYPFVLLAVAGLYELARQVPAGEGTRRSNVFGLVERGPGEAWGPTTQKYGNPKWKSRIVSTLLVVAVALNAADALRYAPDYLSYFTVFVPQRQSWRYLADSSLDWGQGLIALRQYEQQHAGQRMHVAYFTNAIGPDRYGVEAIPFGEDDRPSGTVIVSPGVLSGQYNDEQEAYRWILKYPIKSVLNHNLLVFDIPKM